VPVGTRLPLPHLHPFPHANQWGPFPVISGLCRTPLFLLSYEISVVFLPLNTGTNPPTHLKPAFSPSFFFLGLVRPFSFCFSYIWEFFLALNTMRMQCNGFCFLFFHNGAMPYLPFFPLCPFFSLFPLQVEGVQYCTRLTHVPPSLSHNFFAPGQSRAGDHSGSKVWIPSPGCYYFGLSHLLYGTFSSESLPVERCPVL